MARKRKVEGPAPEQSGAVPALVRMVRDGKEADVHPAEVENWAKVGWREVRRGSDN